MHYSEFIYINQEILAQSVFTATTPTPIFILRDKLHQKANSNQNDTW
jgi:hypothetical protein